MNHLQLYLRAGHMCVTNGNAGPHAIRVLLRSTLINYGRRRGASALLSQATLTLFLVKGVNWPEAKRGLAAGQAPLPISPQG